MKHRRSELQDEIKEKLENGWNDRREKILDRRNRKKINTIKWLDRKERSDNSPSGSAG